MPGPKNNSTGNVQKCPNMLGATFETCGKSKMESSEHPLMCLSADGTRFQCHLTQWRLSKNTIIKTCIWVDVNSMLTLLVLKSRWLFDSHSDTIVIPSIKQCSKWTNKKHQQENSTVLNPIPPLLCFFYHSFISTRCCVWHHAIIMSILLRAAGLAMGWKPWKTNISPPAGTRKIIHSKSAFKHICVCMYVYIQYIYIYPIWFSIWKMSMNFLYTFLFFFEDLGQDCLPFCIAVHLLGDSSNLHEVLRLYHITEYA